MIVLFKMHVCKTILNLSENKTGGRGKVVIFREGKEGEEGGEREHTRSHAPVISL